MGILNENNAEADADDVVYMYWEMTTLHNKFGKGIHTGDFNPFVYLILEEVPPQLVSCPSSVDFLRQGSVIKILCKLYDILIEQSFSAIRESDFGCQVLDAATAGKFSQCPIGEEAILAAFQSEKLFLEKLPVVYKQIVVGCWEELVEHALSASPL